MEVMNRHEFSMVGLPGRIKNCTYCDDAGKAVAE